METALAFAQGSETLLSLCHSPSIPLIFLFLSHARDIKQHNEISTR